MLRYGQVRQIRTGNGCWGAVLDQEQGSASVAAVELRLMCVLLSWGGSSSRQWEHSLLLSRPCPPAHALLQGRFSPTWEMMSAARHMLLMLCTPLHSVTCYEVGRRCWGPELCALQRLARSCVSCRGGCRRRAAPQLDMHAEMCNGGCCVGASRRPVLADPHGQHGMARCRSHDPPVPCWPACSCPCTCPVRRRRPTRSCTRPTCGGAW